MRRLAPLFLCLLVSIAFGRQEVGKTYLGMFMSGHRIGYTESSVSADTTHGAANRSDSKTVMSAGLLGADVDVVMTSRMWTNATALPVRLEYLIESAGRKQSMVAEFGESAISLEIDNNGSKSARKIQRPTDGRVVDDAVSAVLADGPSAKARVYYVLDPMTAALVKNEAQVVGPTQVVVKGQSFKATEVKVTEPRAITRAYFSSKGDLIKIAGPMGIDMWPLTAEEALAPFEERPAGADLAFGTSLKLNKSIPDPTTLRRLRLKVTGSDMGRLPSDSHQSLKQDKDGWILEIHPPAMNAATTIEEAGKQKPEWLTPGLNIPSDDAQMATLAKEAIGEEKTVATASERVREYVYSIMRPNAGIGVLRDAREVLKTKEGVCRDYATLAAALLRAGGIPTRLVSGLVYQDGAFYYHAWVEVWDGVRWSGVDPTRDEMVTPGHIKLGQGTVEEAFTFPILDGAKLEVVGVIPR